MLNVTFSVIFKHRAWAKQSRILQANYSQLCWKFVAHSWLWFFCIPTFFRLCYCHQPPQNHEFLRLIFVSINQLENFPLSAHDNQIGQKLIGKVEIPLSLPRIAKKSEELQDNNHTAILILLGSLILLFKAAFFKAVTSSVYVEFDHLTNDNAQSNIFVLRFCIFTVIFTIEKMTPAISTAILHAVIGIFTTRQTVFWISEKNFDDTSYLLLASSDF